MLYFDFHKLLGPVVLANLQVWQHLAMTNIVNMYKTSETVLFFQPFFIKLALKLMTFIAPYFWIHI